MNVFAVSLQMPPTSNNLFINVGKRRVVSKEYRDWRARNAPLVYDAWERQGSPAFTKPIGVIIHLGLNYKGDIANREKALTDLIVATIPDFPDDRYIDRIEIERVPGMDGARILVTQLGGEARQIGDVLAPQIDALLKRRDAA